MNSMYIRKKDGRIAEVKENMTIKRCSEGVLRLVYKDNRSICVLNGNDDIVKQSENIEDLCDEFVVFDKEQPNGNLLYYKGFENLKKEFIDFENDKEKVVAFGGIWTDKGLLYVAKMNDKGELELIWAIYGLNG